MQYVLIIKLDSHWLDLRENLEETWGNASFYLNVLHRSPKSPISVFPSTNSGKRSMSTAFRTSWLKLVRPWLSYGISHHFVCRSVANSKFTVNNLSRYWTDSLPNNPRYIPFSLITQLNSCSASGGWTDLMVQSSDSQKVGPGHSLSTSFNNASVAI